jgi:hypothetical protein
LPLRRAILHGHRSPDPKVQVLMCRMTGTQRRARRPCLLGIGPMRPTQHCRLEFFTCANDAGIGFPWTKVWARKSVGMMVSTAKGLASLPAHKPTRSSQMMLRQSLSVVRWVLWRICGIDPDLPGTPKTVASARVPVRPSIDSVRTTVPIARRRKKRCG